MRYVNEMVVGFIHRRGNSHNRYPSERRFHDYPYPAQERERIDRHQRPAVSSDYLIRTLLSAHPAIGMGRPK